MTKNGIIGLSAGAIAVLGALTFYTQSAFSSQLEQAITTSQNGQAKISIESEAKGLLSGTTQYKVTFSRDSLQQLAPTQQIDEALELYVNHSYNSYPLLVASEFSLDLTKGAAKDFMAAFPNQNIEHLMTVNTNLLTQSQTTALSIKPTTLKNDEVTVTLGDVSATSETDLSFKSGDVKINFEKLVLDLGNEGLFNLNSLATTATIGDLDGMVYAKNSVMSLANVSFVKEAHQVSMDMTDLSMVSSYSNEQSEAISGKSLVSIASINVNNALAKYNVANTTIDMTVNNIDKAGLVAIDKASKNGSNPSEIMDAAKLILARGIDGTINTLNTTVNDVNLTSNGTFALPSYTGNDLQGELQRHFMTQFGFDYSVNLSNNYGEVFPQFAPMIDGMTAQGFVKADAKGNLSTVIKMDAGAITANDKRIR